MNKMSIPAAVFDGNKKIWTTPSVPSVYNTDCALGRIIFNEMKNHPETVVQIDHSTNVTLKNHEALSMAKRIAQHFDKMQLQQDDIIGFAANSTTFVLPTVLGCLFNCTPFHAINPVYDQSLLADCFHLTKPRVIFCDSEFYQKVYLATKAFKPKIFTISGAVEGVAKVADLLEPTKTELSYSPKQYSLSSHQTVAILSSSGTTGRPKAVCLSGFNLIFATPSMKSETISYVTTGIDWFSGLAILLLSCLNGATRLIVDQPFSSDLFIELVKKHKLNNVFMAPRNIADLVQHPEATKENLSSIMIFQTGGSTMTESVCNKLRALLNENAAVRFSYGLTEFGIAASNFITPIPTSPITSVGKLLPNLSLRIVDDDGNNVGYNKIGEICLNHGKHWGGYYGNPVETEQMHDARGWFHTGDLGYMNDNNFLYVIDRKKEIRKYLGLHFWPKDIEEAIVEMPGVRDVCVITVPDDSKDDCAGALVVKAAAYSSITEQDVIEYVKERFPDVQKQIHAGVFFIDQIPQNSNGKLVRRECQKIFEAKLERS